jgi:hypothetical protein
VESECNGLFLTLWDAEVDACNDSVANEGSVRNELPRSEVERKWSALTASIGSSSHWHGLHLDWGGGEMRFSGSGAGKCVDIVRLLYIIRLWASLLICRKARERA